MDADSGEWTLSGPASPSPHPDSHLYQMPTEGGKGPTQPGKGGNQSHQSHKVRIKVCILQSLKKQ